MQLLFLPLGWTILLDSVAWAILQPAIAYLCTRLPASVFDARQWLFRARRWEQGGALYDRLLRVKAWKSRLPSGGTALAGGFSMKQVASRQPEHLERWVQETCRAELTHWLALFVAGFFFLWNPPLLGVAMVLYAVALNGPCIVVQRYNRPRLVGMLRR